MVLIFFVVAVLQISFYRSAKSLPRALFHSSNTFWKKNWVTVFFTVFLVFSLELHDPIEASLESTGHGGYLCQPWGEELLKQSKWCLHSTPGCVAHRVNNSICVWKAEWTTGCVVYIHIRGVMVCKGHGCMCLRCWCHGLVFFHGAGKNKYYYY